MSEGDLFEIRRRKLEALEAAGVEAFPRGYDVDTTVGDVRARYDDWDAERLDEGDERFRLAGRIVSARGHGKTQFSDIDDGSARLQLYVRRDDLGEEPFALWQDLDLGDFVGVEGKLMRTRSGELTLRVDGFSLLSKALRPLPEKWHGLKDTEIRYRQRYLDLAASEEVRALFRKRAAAVRALRAHLDANGFVEVETPIMQPQYGGALARPFTTHHNALDVDLYLRIAPELYLKRLLVGGLPRVYELARNFRNEGISTRHNPEFTMLEFYAAYWDYEAMMSFAEELLSVTVEATLGAGDFTYQDREISMARPWKRLRFAEALVDIGGVPAEAVMDVEALRSWDGLGEELEARGNKTGELRLADLWEMAFERHVQPTLDAPTFVTHFPREISPFSKASPDDEALVERFELFWGGLEVSNGYSELNDPRLQRRSMEAMGDAPSPELNEQRVDEDYITALEHGMPPAAGIGIGIDRMMMLLSDSASIRDVILFPQLKPKSVE